MPNRSCFDFNNYNTSSERWFHQRNTVSPAMQRVLPAQVYDLMSRKHGYSYTSAVWVGDFDSRLFRAGEGNPSNLWPLRRGELPVIAARDPQRTIRGCRIKSQMGSTTLLRRSRRQLILPTCLATRQGRPRLSTREIQAVHPRHPFAKRL